MLLWDVNSESGGRVAERRGDRVGAKPETQWSVAHLPHSLSKNPHSFRKTHCRRVAMRAMTGPIAKAASRVATIQAAVSVVSSGG
jgi:hypothetical protein